MSFGMGQMIITTLTCIFKHETLQYVTEVMEAYIKEAQEYEREIFYKYIEKSFTFYKGSILLSYTSATIFLLGSLVFPISLPLEVEYPFPINNTAVYVFLYFHQSLVIYQCTAHTCIVTFVALILWYTAARFECLAMQFDKVSDLDTMAVCIRKHLQLTRQIYIKACFIHVPN
ncbi:PREDICTED: uncharacterized protein LOC108551337 [Eufriesea mexicana]|uniref:uncharacterized protein LOC108551337 n=1 Tax=Eufriesea mexicana TaxID=516756 RepID=UPI00083C4F49|nr:PREDICTED: uncharacterized protein LOC108551337 [Eufriesea mexicana]